MNTRSRLLVALVEIVGAAWITYQQLPAHDQQRIRMEAYRTTATILHNVARRIGEMALRTELRYARECAR